MAKKAKQGIIQEPNGGYLRACFWEDALKVPGSSRSSPPLAKHRAAPQDRSKRDSPKNSSGGDKARRPTEVEAATKIMAAKAAPRARRAKRAGFQKELIDRGCVARTSGGEPICVAYNLDGCQDANTQPGEKCKKGFHVCAKAGRHDCHSQKDCRE